MIGRLFITGPFVLHSGEETDFLIDCEGLEDKDLEALAHMAYHKMGIVPRAVEGIPEGGLRFADAMRSVIEGRRGYVQHGPLLIVDDVLTTGTSMEKACGQPGFALNVNAVGCVIFARSTPAPGITALFQMCDYKL